MRVVLSLGGSVLAPELDPERVAAYADAIERLVDEGCELGVVVGGGVVDVALEGHAEPHVVVAVVGDERDA